MPSLYPNLESLPWEKVLELNRPALPRPPFSAHCPLNFPGAKDMVILDGAFNAAVLPIPPGMDNANAQHRELLRQLRLRTLTFLPEEIPFIMDFHHGKLEREKGDLPQYRASYYAYFTQYSFQYAMSPEGRLAIRATIRNEGEKAERKHLWLKVAHPLEKEFYDYHYVTYHFTNSHFPALDTSCRFAQNTLWHQDRLILRLSPGAFHLEWVEEAHFPDKAYTEGKFYWDSPYFVHREYRLPEIRNLLHFQVDLEPGEEQSLEAVMDTALPGGLPEEVPSFQEIQGKGEEWWTRQEKDLAQVDFGDPSLNQRFRVLQRVTRQLLFTMDWPGKGPILFPCQGGLSERFFMWVWEAMCAFLPMMRLGHFQEPRKILEFVFSLQDGGYPPVGEFVEAPGAIGTTGPKWACVTGSALTWAALYIQASHDHDFAKKYLDPMARACSWIVAQIRAPHPDDYPYPGLMPKACSTDADYGRLVITTDNWSCRGLELAANVLLQYGHPQGPHLAHEAARYKADLMECLHDLTQPDGYVRRQIDDSGTYCPGFVNCDSFSYLAYSGLVSLHDPTMRRFIQWCEEHSCQDFFFGAMTPHLIYIGTGEEIAALVQMANGETKKAWSAIQTFERYGCSQDAFLTQERFDVDDPEHISWQPNASNNGRMLDMELARLYLETDRKILVLAGFAPFELTPGRHFAIHGLHTPYGKLDMEAQDGKVFLQWETPPPLPIVLPPGWQRVDTTP